MMSDRASVCPNCGNLSQIEDNSSSSRKSKRYSPLFVVFITLVVTGGLFYYYNLNYLSKEQEEHIQDNSENIIDNNEKVKTENENGIEQRANWNYHIQKDPLTDKISYHAFCESENTSVVCGQSAKLYLGVVHNYGGNFVILTVNAGVLRQDRLPMAYVRFDDGETKSWSVIADGANNHHIVAANNFIQELKSSKKCAIKVEAQDGGTATYTFHTAGLEWNHTKEITNIEKGPYSDYSQKGYEAGRKYGQRAVTSNEEVLASKMYVDYINDYNENPLPMNEKVKAYVEAYHKGFFDTYGK
jgi:hypothetical protein